MSWVMFRTIIWFAAGMLWCIVFGMELNSYIKDKSNGILVLFLDAILAISCAANGFMLFFNFQRKGGLSERQRNLL